MKTLLLPFIFFVLMAGKTFAQMPDETGKTNSISVDLWIAPANQNLPAPAAIHMVATVSTMQPGHTGDTIKVNFLADSNYLGSARCAWHEGHQPDPHSHLPQPMIIIRPGYSGAQWVWTNVPAGTYSLTAAAIDGNGLTAVSEPKKVTVLP